MADDLIAQSIEEHGHQFAAIEYGNPLLDKYFYVETKGRTKTWTSTHTKMLTRTNNPKNLKAIQASGVAEELLDKDALGGEQAQEELQGHPLFERLKSLADVGRSAPLGSHVITYRDSMELTWSMPPKSLRLHGPCAPQVLSRWSLSYAGEIDNPPEDLD